MAEKAIMLGVKSVTKCLKFSFLNIHSLRISHSRETGWQKLFSSYKSCYLSAAVVIATFEIQYMAEN